MNRIRVKRIAAMVLIPAAGYILQSTLCSHIALALVKPNLLMIITAAFGFTKGSLGGMLAGFFLGLFTDIQFGGVIGFYALIYMLFGFAQGLLSRLFLEEDIVRPVIFIGISEMIYGLVVYLLTFMLRSEFNFIYYLNHVIIPEMLYTVAAAFLIYPLILSVEQKSRH